MSGEWRVSITKLVPTTALIKQINNSFPLLFILKQKEILSRKIHKTMPTVAMKSHLLHLTLINFEKIFLFQSKTL